MRLLVVTPEFPPQSGGGISKYYATIVAAWVAAGVDVSVLVASPFSEARNESINGVPIAGIALDEIERHATRLTHLGPAPLFRRYLASGLAAADWVRARADRFDVIETTDFGLLCAGLVALENRPPVLVKLHGSLGQIAKHEPPAPASELDYALAALTESLVLPAADALEAYSPANAAEWQARLNCAVDFIPPPLALPALPTSAPTQTYAGVVVGRVQAWKGPDVLCAALSRLGDRTPADLTVAWVGRDTSSAPDGQSMSRWLAKKFPGVWGDRIVPLGQCPPAEVAHLQAAARFVIVPSHWDTFNYTLAEAMALGRVVIASTGAGASYLIEDGVNGLLFADGDDEALGERLVRAYAMSDDARRAMGAAGRDTIQHALAPSAIATQTIASLSRLQNRRAATSTIGPWIRDFLSPDSTGTVNRGFLENVSIRDLAGHLTERLSRKVLGTS